jgi:hypothetical protein
LAQHQINVQAAIVAGVLWNEHDTASFHW